MWVRYRERLPAPALRRIVACYWTLTPVSSVDAATPLSQRVLPDGCMDILVRVGRDGAEANVVGTMTRAIVVPLDDTASFVGVRFRPGEATALLDVAASDARDAFLTPVDAGFRCIEELAHSVARHPPNAWPSVLDAWLLDHLSRRARPADARVRRAIDLLFAARGTVRTSSVANAVGVSERHMERAFVERVGVAPKLLARTFRLHALVAHLDVAAGSTPRAPIAWASLAAEIGYADQAHLVRDVRALSGVTPTVLYRERMSGLFNTARAGAATQTP